MTINIFQFLTQSLILNTYKSTVKHLIRLRFITDVKLHIKKDRIRRIFIKDYK